MDTQLILFSAAALGGVGGAAAVLLATAARFFRVEEDQRVVDILAILPGANCGGCGKAGCAGFAAALVNGTMPPNACNPGGPDLAKRIAAILGVTVAEKEPQVMRLLCGGGHDRCRPRFLYEGLSSCKAVMLVAQGGTKPCPYGCEGLGDCVRVCLFGALSMGKSGLPVVDESKCTACGACAQACPKHVLALVGKNSRVTVRCSTKLPAKLVAKACKAGCIACKKCVKDCPYGAITMNGNLPVVDHDQCTRCGICLGSCKFGVLTFPDGLVPDPAAREAADRIVAERKAVAEAAAAARKAAAEAGTSA